MQNPDNSKTYSYDLESVGSWSTTTHREEIFSHRWTIDKFNAYLKMTENKDISYMKISSSVFTDRSPAGLSWYLECRTEELNRHNNPGNEFIVELHAIKNNRNVVVTNRVELSVLDANDKPVLQSDNSRCRYRKEPLNWMINSIIVGKVKNLLQTPNKFVVDDQLKIHFRVWVQTFDTQHFFKVKFNTETNLRKDYKGLLSSSMHHDVVIITDAKQEIKAHRSILSARSSVFAAMFQTDMSEASTGKVTISNFEGKIIQEMLNFIYSGELYNLKENAVELLKISDVYDIKDLKQECVQIIPSILTCENVVDILQVVNAYNDLYDLKRKIFQFISQNKRSVKNTAGLQNLDELVLLKELIENL